MLPTGTKELLPLVWSAEGPVFLVGVFPLFSIHLKLDCGLKKSHIPCSKSHEARSHGIGISEMGYSSYNMETLP